jgi:hypothetical protein
LLSNIFILPCYHQAVSKSSHILVPTVFLEFWIMVINHLLCSASKELFLKLSDEPNTQRELLIELRYKLIYLSSH